MWGVVWDQKPGALFDDADSFFVSVDDENPEWLWVYGCNTEGTDSGWTYQPVTDNPVQMGCAPVLLSWNLSAGDHTLRLRNRENSDFNGAAAIARVLITSDVNAVPTL